MTGHQIDELRTCHDIRHWRSCDACAGLGDERVMIQLHEIGLNSTWHGDCVVQSLSQKEILRLPTEELQKFTINDTGVELMRKIVAEVERR